MPATPQANTQAPETTAAAAPVSDKRTVAAGVIPKQMQSWIFLSVILVAAVGLWFSSSAKSKPSSNSVSAAGEQSRPVVGGLTPEEVQRRLQESEDGRRSALASAHANRGARSDIDDPSFYADATLAASNQSASETQDKGRDAIEEDERKRDYAGRFASNVALSYRSDSRAIAASASPVHPLATTDGTGDAANNATPSLGLPSLPPEFQRQLDLLEVQQQKLLAQQQELTALPSPGSQAQSSKAQNAPVSIHRHADLNAATGRDHVIFEGTVLESVLVNRLNSDFAGPVICQITNDVYSHDRAQLLIPAGTRVLGETRKISDPGQERLAVVFHRLIMPDGYAVDLDQAPGLNQIGETALHDRVNNHYFKIFGSSIAVGAIAGLASIGTNNSSATGLPTSSASAYREGVAGSLSQSSLHILDRFLNIPPTITIREGHRVRIFLTQDLALPAYAQHKMPSDI